VGRGGTAPSGKCEDGEGEAEKKKTWSDARDPIDQIVQLEVYMLLEATYEKDSKP
jgi:hypothetical protein